MANETVSSLKPNISYDEIWKTLATRKLVNQINKLYEMK